MKVQRSLRGEFWILIACLGNFPGGPVVKNMPRFNAGDTDSISGQGTKIPYAAEQLSACPTMNDPAWRHRGENILRRG